MKNKTKGKDTSCNITAFALAAALFFFSMPSTSFAAPGELDLTFSGDGKLTDRVGSAYGVAIQPDGKIVVVGGSTSWDNADDFQISRYNPDGTPDTTFGVGTGRVTTDFGGNYEISSRVVIQPDGKILVAGASQNSVFMGGLAMARYNPDGSLDTAFGGGSGKVLTIAPCWRSARGGGVDIAIQPNGKIVAVVGSTDYDEDCETEGFLFRYHQDGSPDASMGIVSAERAMLSVLIQPSDGKIVTSEWFQRFKRFDSDGSFDTDFGSAGILTLPPNFSLAGPMAFDTAGKIVAGGYYYNGSTYPVALFRFSSNGSPDSSFDGDGIVTIPSLRGVGAIVIQSNGKIIVAGSANSFPNYNFALARYNSNGSLDSTFGSGGVRTLDFNNSSDYIADATLDGSGRAVVVGGSDGKFAIARFLLATKVSISGRVTTPGGLGLRNALVTVIDSAGNRRTVLSSSLGYYIFNDVPAEENYTISVQSKRFRFEPKNILINDNLTEINFVGQE